MGRTLIALWHVTQLTAECIPVRQMGTGGGEPRPDSQLGVLCSCGVHVRSQPSSTTPLDHSPPRLVLLEPQVLRHADVASDFLSDELG